jgi:hypothetical protein
MMYDELVKRLRNAAELLSQAAAVAAVLSGKYGKYV